MKLIRKDFRDDGIFSELRDDAGNLICVTGTHSYDKKPIVPCGTFKCVRGKHRLHGMNEDLETFEITGVPGHTGLLFHIGNYPQIESEGCELVGRTLCGTVKGMMVVDSRSAFVEFMQSFDGIDEFLLMVQ